MMFEKNQWQNNPKWPDVLYAQKAHQQLPNLYKNKPRVLLPSTNKHEQQFGNIIFQHSRRGKELIRIYTIDF